MHEYACLFIYLYYLYSKITINYIRIVIKLLVIDRYWFNFITDTDTNYLHVFVPDNRYAEPIFIYRYKVNK